MASTSSAAPVGSRVEPIAASPAKGKPAPPPVGHGPLIPTVLSWVLFAVFPLFCLPTWGWALWRAARRGRRSVVGAVVACPLVAVPLFSAGLGFVGYFTGSAVLRGVGLPGPGYSNLHRELRCRRSSSGCMVSGHEPFTQLPNNLVLLGLGRLFGPVCGAYDGPYPTAEEAEALLRAARPTRVLPGAPAVVVDGRALPVELLADAQGAGIYGGGDVDQARCYRLALVGGRCLVIGEARRAHAEDALLVDVEGGRTIARYRLPRE